MSLSWFFQLSLLLTALLLEPSHCRKDCKDKCCSFLDNFSMRLKKLRTSFAKIWDYYMSLLLTALLLEPSHCRKDCKDKCCSFLDNFSVRLKDLRTSFAKIRDYYEDKDDSPTALLDENVLNDFQSPFGCHAMNEVLRFYLDTVLPTAMHEKANKDYIHPISSIRDIFNELKKEVINCRNHFFCKKPFQLDSIMTEYKTMHGQGLYKAMGELGLLFNYIEEYMASIRLKH